MILRGSVFFLGRVLIARFMTGMFAHVLRVAIAATAATAAAVALAHGTLVRLGRWARISEGFVNGLETGRVVARWFVTGWGNFSAAANLNGAVRSDVLQHHAGLFELKDFIVADRD
jgi:hypothetical protein